MDFTEIQNIANAILVQASIDALPVKIDELAKSLGIKVVPYPFTNEISGTLIIAENVIGYNLTESRVRRRFTIAHELGHWVLHKGKKTVFLDKLFRLNSANAGEQNHEMEMEANVFAAAILMPETFIRNELKNIEFDLGDEDALRYLARKFDVSITAMYYRLKNLGIF